TALRNYQSHNGLEVTGNLTAETENSLTGSASAGNKRSYNDVQSKENLSQNQPYRSQDLSQSQSMPSASSQNQSTRDSLGLSSENNLSDREDIRHIQQALTDLMYNPGEVNGMMSSQTQQAIREFQYLNGLPVTGN